MQLRGSVVGITCVLFASIVVPHASASSEKPAAATALLQIINGHRTDLGLAPLREDPFIDPLAQDHSNYMARLGAPRGLNHDGFTGSGGRLEQIEAHDGDTAVCENVAYVYGPKYRKQAAAMKKIYSLWNKSHEGHHECMFDQDHVDPPPYPTDPRNVAGVAVTKSGSFWWATFDAANDPTI